MSQFCLPMNINPKYSYKILQEVQHKPQDGTNDTCGVSITKRFNLTTKKHGMCNNSRVVGFTTDVLKEANN